MLRNTLNIFDDLWSIPVTSMEVCANFLFDEWYICCISRVSVVTTDPSKFPFITTDLLTSFFSNYIKIMKAGKSS